MTRGHVIGVLVALVLCIGGTAHAGDEPETEAGRAYFATGSDAFKRGDFAAAADAFKRGYAEEKWNGFLFAWAQAERSGGSCPAAIELYSRFIATEPPAEAKQHALGWIEVCGGTYTPPKPAPEPAPIPPPTTPAAPPEPPPRADEPEGRGGPGFQHKLAIGLGVASAASAVIAVRCYTWSQRDAEASLIAPTYADRALRYERATRRLTIARVTGGVALGLAVAATLRIVLAREPASSGIDVALSPHGELLVTGSF